MFRTLPGLKRKLVMPDKALMKLARPPARSSRAIPELVHVNRIGYHGN